MITGYLVVLIFVWVWLETKNNDLVDCLWGWVWEEIMAWLAVAKTRWGIVLSTACFCIFLLCPQKLDNLCPDFPVWCQVRMKEGVKWQAHFLLVEAGGKVSGLRNFNTRFQLIGDNLEWILKSHKGQGKPILKKNVKKYAKWRRPGDRKNEKCNKLTKIYLGRIWFMIICLLLLGFKSNGIQFWPLHKMECKFV